MLSLHAFLYNVSFSVLVSLVTQEGMLFCSLWGWILWALVLFASPDLGVWIFIWKSGFLYRHAAAVLLLTLCLPVVGKAHACINRICCVNETWKAKYRCMFLAATRFLLFLWNGWTECNQRNLIRHSTLLCGKDLHEKSWEMLVAPQSPSLLPSTYMQISPVPLHPQPFSVITLICLICPRPIIRLLYVLY